MFDDIKRALGFGGAPRIQASAAPLGFGIPGGGTDGLEAGAGARRMRNFRPGPAHVNTLIAASGQTVTQRARWLARNNPYQAKQKS